MVMVTSGGTICKEKACSLANDFSACGQRGEFVGNL